MTVRIVATLCFLLIHLSALDAGPSPTKAYHDALDACTKPIWLKLTTERVDALSQGTVAVRFDITADGHAENLKVTSNTGNKALADVALATIRQAHFPPIPQAVLRTLPHKRYRADFEFTTVR